MNRMREFLVKFNESCYHNKITKDCKRCYKMVMKEVDQTEATNYRLLAQKITDYNEKQKMRDEIGTLKLCISYLRFLEPDRKIEDKEIETIFRSAVIRGVQPY